MTTHQDNSHFQMSRYTDRERYFTELAGTSREYYINYIRRYKAVDCSCRILEIGCGEGGNLLPFAELGCYVAGLDLLGNKIENARRFFEKAGAKGDFICGNFLEDDCLKDKEKFDVILIHDVIEHIEPEYKSLFFSRLKPLLKTGGIIFFGFPAWHMPFGGHQQICRSRWSRMPFIHLLPKRLYWSYLNLFKENPLQVDELMSISRSRMSTEKFEQLCRDNGYRILDRTLWFISPHYKAKFNLRPAGLFSPLCRIPYLRNYLSTACFYIINVG